MLVAKGFFPTAPSEPRVAITIDLLDFYESLNTSSGTPVSALASTLASFYHKRGWTVLNDQVRASKYHRAKHRVHAVKRF
jgi:predicted acetyltransferase